MPITQPLAAAPPYRQAIYSLYPNPYVVGATAEFRITPRFGIVVDALMRHYRYDGKGQYTGGYSGYSSHTTMNAWEFPLLLRYRFRSGKAVSPFVNAGEAIDWLQHMRQVTSTYYYYGGGSIVWTAPPSELQQRTVAGIVSGAGVDVRLPRGLHLTPQARYTFWTQGHFLDPSQYVLWEKRNQVEFLLGITF